jgi:outer membrane protein OmpA-like peptidoglycan-associated protein
VERTPHPEALDTGTERTPAAEAPARSPGRSNVQLATLLARPAASPGALSTAVAMGVRNGVGNRRLATMLARRPAERRVARFVGHEHETIGNATGADVDLGGGVVLSWGQVVAIAGDEFETIEELQAATASDEGRRRIRAALEHDGVKGPIPASLPAAGDADKDKQGMKFLELAMKNVTHFAAGGSARETWRGHHGRALAKAVDSGMAGDAAAFAQAQAIEAFGQHFLTDMFSGGHVRTPRQEIMDYYQDKAPTMAAAFFKNLRARVEAGLVSQVMLQISPMLRGKYAQDKAREKVHAAVEEKLKEGLAQIGGEAGLARYFGLALAGAVSGAMHDREGRKGVVVASEDHPEPWLAKGDAMLGESPVSQQQAELAVIAAREQLFEARYAGEREQTIEKLIPATPPAVVHFAFDSADLDGGRPAAEAAGAYLHANPGVAVELVGHTDPLGRKGYNQGLGTRRAQAVRDAVIAAGARPDQVEITSAGETNLVTTDPKRHSENRRVEFLWQPDTSWPPPDSTPLDPARARAEAAVAAMGPPFAAVERYVPEAVESMNDPLPEWRWGSMDPSLVADLDTWVRDLVGPQVKKISDMVPETIPAEGYTVAPRQLVDGILAQLIANPSKTLGDLIGTQPGG